MNHEMMVHVNPFEVHVAIMEDNALVEYYIERKKDRRLVGNIYKGKVKKVLPGMQSAFVDIGLDKHAFLYVADFFEEFSELRETLEDTNGLDDLIEEGLKSFKEKSKLVTSKRKASERKITVGKDKACPSDVKEVESVKSEKFVVTEETGSNDKYFEILEQFDVLHESEKIVSLGSDTSQATLNLPVDEAHYSSNKRIRTNHQRRKKSYVLATENEPGNISTMLKQGQEIVVQVMKEPISMKSARITSHISIPGRTLVYLPTVKHIGVSRRIKDEQERKRLRNIVIKHKNGSNNGGFIVRTASEGCSEEDIVNDMQYLKKTWNKILEEANSKSAPALLYEELNLVEKIFRDKLDKTFERIWVDDEDTFAKILNFVDRFMPEMLRNVKLYTKDAPIFDYFNIKNEIQKATKQKVWLKSGGFIVINHTEALVAIDVNTGKYVGGGGNFEETITRINIDAAKEIIRQIRLRNLGGILVLDFIDMQEKKNRKQVMEVIVNELKKDKSPSKVLSFNDFGLVIMTRKRTAGSLEKALSQTCPTCGGSGLIKSISTICYEIFTHVERMKDFLKKGNIVIRANPEVIKALKGDEKEVIEEIQRRYQQQVILVSDPVLLPHLFDISDE